ncbi:MAG: DUF58 domain-containing protein [Nocardioides sp.]|uniref:DUF58 domain-containing protein n=1 Tax=Nocardioides sp. TaxID=35761 RepID=UPI003F034AF7
MRPTLAALTFRGRLFVATGISISVAAWLTGQQSLIPVGVLLAVLPVLAAVRVAKVRLDLGLVRRVAPPVVMVGQSTEVELTLTNRSRTASSVLLLEEALPYVLGSRPRFVLASLPGGASRSVRYAALSDVRGRHPLGPLSVRVTDPFGLAELPRPFSSVGEVTVTPRVVPLTPVTLGGAWTGSGDNRPRSFATGSAEDVTVREYRRGDDLRRVHWRSSARTGELMVRREEQPWQSRATVYLDNRAAAHAGSGPASTLEVAVQVAASVTAHLVRAGFSVRLVTATGDDIGARWHSLDPSAGLAPLLEQLAVLQATQLPVPEAQWLSEPEQGGLVVAVLGRVLPGDRQFLARLAMRSTEALALDLHADAWTGAPSAERPPLPGDLVAAGWRGVVLAPGDDLDVRWRELGRLSARGEEASLWRA